MVLLRWLLLPAVVVCLIICVGLFSVIGFAGVF